jgi:chromate reductase, NAD(P)H dehydrogenase (quinone)
MGAGGNGRQGCRRYEPVRVNRGDVPGTKRYDGAVGEPRSISVLGFAGSLRRESYNRALLRALQEEAPEGMTIDIFDLDAIPLYNADVEAAGDPAPVAAFKEAIRRADTLLIATPEYNHGVPGVLKNAIDWASRPPRQSALDGKPLGIIGASPGITGTARGQSQLRQAFVFTNSYCMPQPEILVYRASEKFDENGRLTDEKTRSHLGRYLRALSEWTSRFTRS